MVNSDVKTKGSNCYRSVALVGIDGSGKSTQAELLRQLLTEEPRGARVFVAHPFGRKLLRVGYSSPVLLESGRRGRKQWKLLRKIVAVADVLDVALYLWMMHLFAIAVTLTCNREVWLVGDRSFDEVLIKHWQRNTFSWRTVERLRRLVPRSETTIWIQVRPGVALVRKDDSDPAQYEGLYTAYSTAADRFGWRVVPDRRRTSDRRRSSMPGRSLERRGISDRRRYPDLGRPLESVFAKILGELDLTSPELDGTSKEVRESPPWKATS